jgi:hypothetical protein
LIVLAPGIERIRQRVALYRRAVSSSAVLLGRVQANSVAHVADMADAIARRRGLPTPDRACELLAEVSFVVLRQALDVWVSDTSMTTTAALTTGFDLLVQELSPDRHLA